MIHLHVIAMSTIAISFTISNAIYIVRISQKQAYTFTIYNIIQHLECTNNHSNIVIDFFRY